jgi:hypothetical protein
VSFNYLKFRMINKFHKLILNVEVLGKYLRLCYAVPMSMLKCGVGGGGGRGGEGSCDALTAS